MKVHRGEVVLVDFPYSDRTGRKVRPALVVQADEWNKRLNDTILALITSSRRRRLGVSTQHLIDLSTTEGALSGLRLDSIVQCENLITYEKSLILRVLGRLPTSTMSEIDTCLRASLGIADRSEETAGP